MASTSDCFNGSLKKSISECIWSKGQNDVSRIVYVDNRLFAHEEQITVPEEQIQIPEYPDNIVISSKYTLLTFLPKNLFEQFQRIANFYFLCVAGVQFVIDTPVTPLTSILPLTFVIAVTAIKQGYEDWLRHKADSEVNLRPTIVVRNGVELEARAMDVKVGDIVRVKRSEEFPCDLVMLSSEDPLGQCFVTTANLDGETSLKTFHCLNETRNFTTAEQLGSLRARITCMTPVTDLYRFEGVMELETGTESKPLGRENLLLRGARLKNTEYIYGCAVYTGKETKMTLNSKSKKTKFSRVERKLNEFLIVFLVVLLAESVISTGLMYWFENENGVPWFVPKEKTKVEALKAVEHALAFMVLYNYIIPISLYVTVEMQKFLGSLFFGMDIDMYDPAINERAQANTSDLNEELGQVEYLFTDKTGTLTENIMVFRSCCIGNRTFEIVDGSFCEKMDSESIDLTSEVQFTEEMIEFFKVLVLCHTVRLEEEKVRKRASLIVHGSVVEDYEYHASSPDEKALVTACSKLGIVYHGMIDNILTVSFHNRIQSFKLMHMLPFDATRKRMSVIVEDGKGDYYLLCKGAEVAIFDRVVDGDVEGTQILVNEYAVLGLRTLVIAERKLSQEEYMECDKILTESKLSMVSRDELLSAAYNQVEQSLTLLGATAVEDRLQDQVPQTIEALRMAGIKVWVLTGDKEETAVNISYSAGHFNTDMHELRLTRVAAAEDCEPQLQELLSQIRAPDKLEYAFIIDGQSLAFAIKLHREILLELCTRCVAVLCCRMSPIQKAEVVAMVKNMPHRPVTAAIGDGANDVSMIQEADVGIGIMGKEGRQAVRNSDYAFGKFKFLRPALLLHGHLYYNRIAVLVQYFFYKNVAWITAQVFYSFFNSFSQQSLFDPFYLMFYNLTFTSLPILIYGLFEQHIPKMELLNNPELYRRISRNSTLSWLEFLKWNLLGLWHCFVFFFGILLLQRNGVSLFQSGVNIGNIDFGSFVLYACVINVNLKLLLETYYWCAPTFIALAITFVGLVGVSAVYTNIYWPASMVSQRDLYGTLGEMYSTPTIWLAMLVLLVAALLPDIIIKVMRDTAYSKEKQYMFRGGRSTCTRVSRDARLASIDFNKRFSDTAIELQSSTNQSSCNTSLTGFDNPAMSLSSEHLPNIEANSGFSGQDIPAIEASGRKRSSTKSEIIVEHPQGNSTSFAAGTSSSDIKYVNDNGYKNNSTMEHEPMDNILQYQELPPVDSTGISYTSSVRSPIPNSSTGIENIEYTCTSHINSPLPSQDLGDHTTSIPTPTISEIIVHNTFASRTQPINIVNTVNDTFLPSPSHAMLSNQNDTPPLGPVNDHENTNTLSIVIESSPL